MGSLHMLYKSASLLLRRANLAEDAENTKLQLSHLENFVTLVAKTIPGNPAFERRKDDPEYDKLKKQLPEAEAAIARINLKVTSRGNPISRFTNRTELKNPNAAKMKAGEQVHSARAATDFASITPKVAPSIGGTPGPNSLDGWKESENFGDSKTPISKHVRKTDSRFNRANLVWANKQLEPLRRLKLQATAMKNFYREEKNLETWISTHL